MTQDDGAVIPLRGDESLMRKAFLGWQCRLRQLAMRDHEGRPSPGMRPRLEVAEQDAGLITVVMTKNDHGESTAAFRHLVKRTHDPKERFDAALRYLQSNYYQDPLSFDDQLTAVFAAHATLPRQIDERMDCCLCFEQFAQRYVLTCDARLLAKDDPGFHATYWHNALFNPSMPADVQIVGFRPVWSNAKADPPPPVAQR